MDVGSVADWLALVVSILLGAVTVYLNWERLQELPISRIKKVIQTIFFGLVVVFLAWVFFQLGKLSTESTIVEVTRIAEVEVPTTIETEVEVTRIVTETVVETVPVTVPVTLTPISCNSANITIDSPNPEDPVPQPFVIRGEFSSIPEEARLWLVQVMRGSPDTYRPKGVATLNLNEHSWATQVDNFGTGGNIEMVAMLVGEDGDIMFDYHFKVGEEGVWKPFDQITSDMHECASVFFSVITPEPTPTPPTSAPETPSATLGDIGFSYIPPVSDVTDMNLELTRVEILPNRMRLHVEIWNESPNDIRIAFRQGFSVLIDEFGNEYSLLTTDAPVIEGSGIESIVIRSGVKTQFWFEFSSPIDEAKSFNVRLFSTGTASQINFSEFSMELEY